MGVEGAEEGEDFLVLGRAQGCAGLVRGRRRRRGGGSGKLGEKEGGQVPEGVLVPGVEHARVPGLVEGRAAEGLDGVLPARPGLAAEGGGAGGRDAGALVPRGVEDDDGGVEEHEGGQQARVQQGEVRQDVGAEGVADADEGARHLGAEDVGEVQQVARVVVPEGVVAQLGLVQLAAVPLGRHVGDPDAADPEPAAAAAAAARPRPRVQVLPQRLVQLLREPVRVRAEDGHVARLRRRVVLGRVLLHVQVQHVLLAVGRAAGPLADVLAGHHVLLYVEGERRHGVAPKYGAATCL